MNIIPVIDLLNGVVVRGVAGQREKYRPICSLLAPSPDPSVIMNAMRQTFGLQQFYIADLDAIQHQRLNRCTIAELSEPDVSLMVDRGVRSEADVEELLDLGVDRVVVALETLAGLHSAAQLLTRFGSEQLVVSLDLQNGRLLTACEDWQDGSPRQIARQLSEVGYRQFIVLDLATVGTNQGVPTLELCRHLHASLPDTTLVTGGGIRGVDDLCELRQSGVAAALVASAMHDGRLSAEDVQSILNGSDDN